MDMSAVDDIAYAKLHRHRCHLSHGSTGGQCTEEGKDITIYHCDPAPVEESRNEEADDTLVPYQEYRTAWSLTG